MYPCPRYLLPSVLLGFMLLGSLGACKQTGMQQLASKRTGIYAVSSPQESQQLSQLGRQLFFEPALSASGKQSCASCHSPEHAYGPPDGQSTQPGGIDGKQAGNRAVPSLRYLQTVPPFSEHFRDNDGNDSEDAGPTGGLTWDGRAASMHEQASIPLLAANEMANANSDQVVRQLQASPSANAFRATFGEGIFRTPQQAFDKLVLALEAFQQSPADFYPYSSKYDNWLRGKATLSSQELRGLQLFNKPDKGNCAACHLSERQSDGAFPAFSDFGLIALGVPRNRQLVVNRNPEYHDMGLCGPLRQDMQQAAYCGLFRTPSLRNVATRQVFFHNGVFHELRQVLEFYASRDTQPEKWYPANAKGKPSVFDDLPPAYHGNINREAPFGGKKGDKAALSADEISAMLAFLATLSDADAKPARKGK
jgi:cytochrome c peroxidase